MTLFFVIAAGPSYMDVSEGEWEYLKNKHTITFSRVPYGSRNTEYYFSIERYYLDKEVLSYIAKLGYLDTKLLLSIPKSLKLARELGFKHIRKIIKQNFYFMPSRQPWFTDEPEPPHSFYETRAKNFHQPLFRFRGQLSAVINACLILGATEIRLIGVDLNNQKNFYQYPEYLKEICKDEWTINRYLLLERNKYESSLKLFVDGNPKFNPNNMHTTNTPITEDRWKGRMIRGIADVIEWMDKSMREEEMRGIYVTNKNSLLYKQNKIEYKGIMDEIK